MPMNIPTFSFPVAHPYEPDNGHAGRSPAPSVPFSMPIPHPFPQGAAPYYAYGTPSGPSAPSMVRPTTSTYGTWQDNGPSAESHNYQHNPPRPQGPPLRSSWSARPQTSSPVSDDSPQSPPALGAPNWQGVAPPLSHTFSEPQRPGASQYAGGVGAQAQELTAEDIKPNDSNFSKLSEAVHELDICKKIFEQCDENFVTEFMVIFPKESLEFQVQSKTDELKNTSSVALTSAQEMHEAQKEFAHLVVTKLKVLSLSSGGGTLLPDPDLSDIWAKVERLRLNITKQTDALRNSIADLSRLIRQAKDKYADRTIRKKLWEWLVRFFEAIAHALGIARHGITAVVIGNAGIIGAAVGASRQSLVAATSAVCKEIKHFNSKHDQGFHRILEFLSGELPKSIRKAEMTLIAYNASQALRKADIESRRDRLTGIMTTEQATKALSEWEAFCQTRN